VPLDEFTDPILTKRLLSKLFGTVMDNLASWWKTTFGQVINKPN
jgi:hypothetical protein